MGLKQKPAEFWRKKIQEYENGKKIRYSLLRYEEGSIFMGPCMTAKVLLDKMNISLVEVENAYSAKWNRRFFGEEGASDNETTQQFIKFLDRFLREKNTTLNTFPWLPPGILTKPFKTLDSLLDVVSKARDDTKIQTEYERTHRFSSVETQLIDFINGEYMAPIQFLAGRQGDGKTTTFNAIKDHFYDYDDHKIVLLEGKLLSNYSLFITSLYEALCPENETDDTFEKPVEEVFARIIEIVEHNQSLKRLVLLLDDFETFNSSRSASMASLRENEIHMLLRELIRADSTIVKIVIGVSINAITDPRSWGSRDFPL